MEINPVLVTAVMAVMAAVVVVATAPAAVVVGPVVVVVVPVMVMCKWNSHDRTRSHNRDWRAGDSPRCFGGHFWAEWTYRCLTCRGVPSAAADFI